MDNKPREFYICSKTLQAFELNDDKIFIEYKGNPPHNPIKVIEYSYLKEVEDKYDELVSNIIGIPTSKMNLKLKELQDFEVKIKAVIQYCEPHLDNMWAARIVGTLLGCDFRDAKEALVKIGGKV